VKVQKWVLMRFIFIFCCFMLLLTMTLTMAPEKANISQNPSLNNKCLSLKSDDGGSKLKVNFINNFPSPVEVVWMDYNGQQVSYGTLPPSEVMSPVTYISHPWAFISTSTGDCIGWYSPKVEDNNKLIEVLSDE